MTIEYQLCGRVMRPVDTSRVSRDCALQDLRDNPNASFGTQTAAKMVAALRDDFSQYDIETMGEHFRRRYAVGVFGSTIRDFANRPRYRLPNAFRD